MANVSELDTTTLIQKFISTSSTGQNTIEEVTNIINTIATSFLLHPQIALSFIIKNKNVLLNNINKEIALLNDISKRLNYLGNKETAIKDTSSLIEAQTVLLELDRLGNIDSKLLTRYNDIINNFAKRNLNTVKSGSRTELRLNSNEAKEDIYVGLASFLILHELVRTQIINISNSLDNFKKTDLKKVVTRKLISNLRTSLTDLKQQIDLQNSTKLTSLLELFSGKASLNALAKPFDVLDPNVKTGVIPPGTKITASSAPAAATALSPNAGPWSSTFGTFLMKVDNKALSTVTFPATGANQRAFIVCPKIAANYTIPTNGKLYIRLTISSGRTPNAGLFTNVGNKWVIPVPLLLGGNLTFDQIKTAIESGTTVGDDLFGITQFCFATEFAHVSNFQLLIYGKPGIDKIEILSDVEDQMILAPFVKTASAAFAVGFTPNQSSDPINTVDPYLLATCLNLNNNDMTAAVENSKLRITSKSTGIDSQLQFFTSLATATGFVNDQIFLPISDHLFLQNNDTTLRLEEVDVYLNYKLTTNGIPGTITQIDNDKLTLDIPSPIGAKMPITVISDLSIAVDDLLKKIKRYIGTFDKDQTRLNLALTPIITSNPTDAQIGDVRRYIIDTVNRLTALKNDLQSVPATGTKSRPELLAKEIITTLQNRNMDNLISLLDNCQFLEFFNSEVDDASSGTSFLKALEEVGQNDVNEPKELVPSTSTFELID